MTCLWIYLSHDRRSLKQRVEAGWPRRLLLLSTEYCLPDQPRNTVSSSMRPSMRPAWADGLPKSCHPWPPWAVMQMGTCCKIVLGVAAVSWSPDAGLSAKFRLAFHRKHRKHRDLLNGAQIKVFFQAISISKSMFYSPALSCFFSL